MSDRLNVPKAAALAAAIVFVLLTVDLIELQREKEQVGDKKVR